MIVTQNQLFILLMGIIAPLNLLIVQKANVGMFLVFLFLPFFLAALSRNLLYVKLGLMDLVTILGASVWLLMLFLSSASFGKIFELARFFAAFSVLQILLRICFSDQTLYASTSNTKLWKWLIFISVAVLFYDVVMIHYFGAGSRLLASDAPSYQDRPLGLNIQMTVNAVFLVMFWIMSRSDNDRTILDIYFIIVVMGLLMVQSTLGWICLGLAVLQLKWDKIFSPNLFLVLVLSSLLILSIVSAPQIVGFWFQYLLVIVDQYIEAASFSSVLTGKVFNNEFPIDLAPLFTLYHAGLVWTFVIIIIYAYSIIRLFYLNRKLGIALTILGLGSLHYPSIFYFFGAFFFAYCISLSGIINRLQDETSA